MSTITTSPTTPCGQLPPSSLPDQHDCSVLSQQSSLGDDVSLHGGDTEKHTKGKRKRTAAKDKMILEHAYRTNTKPDKQARREIVNRVSLNEKEVQIWFQNRRQNDRRKSRPLSAEELAALRFGGMHHVSLDHDPSRGCTMAAFEPADPPFSSSDPSSSRPEDRGPAGPVSPRLRHTRRELARSHSDVAAVAAPKPERESSPPRSQTLSQSQNIPSSQKSEHTSESLSHSFSAPVGYLANRWNLGSSFSTPTLRGGGDDAPRPHRLETVLPSSCSSDTTHHAHSSKTELQPSQVRLSLSLEGKAELVSGHVSPSQPPRSRTPPSTAMTASGPAPRPRAGLSRSHSALPSITLPPISALTSALPPARLGRGRSRDVQAWESCADAERRDELTAQAEHESNGSAIAAISLLRSTSGILQTSSAKRNASLSRPPQQARQAKKAKFSRTSSTFGRLETAASSVGSAAAAEKRPLSSKPDGKVKVSMLVSPTGSDKENWSPDEDGVPREGRRHDGRRVPRPVAAPPATKGPPASMNARRLGRVLRDHAAPAPPMLGSRSHTAPSRPVGSLASPSSTTTISIFEDGSPSRKKRAREDDVERFMRGEVSPSKKPDMDCVAGLLSLSQGAWR